MDLTSNISITQSRAAAACTGDTDCASIDMQGYSGLLLLVTLGATGDTLDGSNYIELEVEESGNDSDFTDVADADLSSYVSATSTGTFALINAADEDSLTYSCEYLGSSRYIRVVLATTGTHTNGTPISVHSIRYNPTYAPVA